jgi:DNA repair protein RecN (Recombination protein N)
MLEELNVHNVGVINTANIEFHEGLNVLTGETGAGKTIILTSLGLLLGNKSDVGFIRKNCDSLTVDATWLNVNENVIKTVSEVEGEIDNNRLLVSRVLNSSGKNKSICGGRPVPNSVLATISENLIAIHGQSDQVKLRNVNLQRETFDKYCGYELETILKEYKQKYSEIVSTRNTIKQLTQNMSQLEAEKYYAEMVKKDYEKYSPTIGEEEELKEKIEKLSHVEELYMSTRQALQNAGEADFDGATISSMLNQMVKNLQEVEEYDPAVKNIHDTLLNVEIMYSEMLNDLRNYSESIDTDVIEELNLAHERLADLTMLCKKYVNGGTVEELISFMETTISKTFNQNINVEELEEKLKTLEQEGNDTADKLSSIRKKNISKLVNEVNNELSGLNMSGSELYINHTVSQTLQPHGIDDIEFMLKTPSMVTPKPIAKAASGGELSRIMLALEVVLADPSKTPTMIFDEVDSGVGGSTAIEIGKRLARLAKECQVIVVTHLPQVAAFADNHIKVSKTLNGDIISSEVSSLSEEERRKELTRMFAGLENSETGLQHAEELITLATNYKQS